MKQCCKSQSIYLIDKNINLSLESNTRKNKSIERRKSNLKAGVLFIELEQFIEKMSSKIFQILKKRFFYQRKMLFYKSIHLIGSKFNRKRGTSFKETQHIKNVNKQRGMR